MWSCLCLLFSSLLSCSSQLQVEHNYRLGVLGFLSLPVFAFSLRLTMQELQAESPQASTGNYALQDQQFALQFVARSQCSWRLFLIYQEYCKFYRESQGIMLLLLLIPQKITIFGESAGAFRCRCSSRCVLRSVCAGTSSRPSA